MTDQMYISVSITADNISNNFTNTYDFSYYKIYLLKQQNTLKTASMEN